MNNPLFVEPSIVDKKISFLTKEFKNRTLFYQIKENYFWVKNWVKDEDFLEFLKNKNKNNKFINIIKFYKSFYEPKFESLEFVKILFSAIFWTHLSDIIKNWYITDKDYFSIIKKYKIKAVNKNENNYYIKDLYNNYKNILEDFLLAKELLFLDYSLDKDKVFINIELLCYANTISWDYVSETDYSFYLTINEILEIFSVTNNSNFTLLNKWVNNLFNNTFNRNFSKWDSFYLSLFNKVFSDKKIDVEEAITHFKKINFIYIKQKFWNTYNIIDDSVYKNKDFLYLWLYSIFIYNTSIDNQIIFPKDFHDSFLNPKIKKELEVYENLNIDFIINEDINNLFLEDLRIDVCKKFFASWNINKKNIKYKQKELNDYKDKSHLISWWLRYTLDDLFDLTNTVKYQVFLEPLYLASKRFLSTNTYYWRKFYLPEKFFEDFEKFQNKYLDKIINIESFIIDFFETNIDYYNLFWRVSNDLVDLVWRKIDDTNTYNYLFDEANIFKRVLVYLSRLWYLDLYWDVKKRDIYYSSWNWYWWNYWYSENREIIDIFEPEYIKFKNINLDNSFHKDNYISANDIFLSFDISDIILDKLSKFCVLEKLDSHIVLNISRDTLIKAKNEYEFDLNSISNIFKNELKLTLPKNIDLLIQSINNQKVSLSLLPLWIPVICDNLWVFQELLSLKMFSDWIIFSDKEKLIIVFKDNYHKKLKNTLTKRKVLFDEK